MERRIATIISYLFHPLLMPTYGLFLFFYLDKHASYFLPFEIKRTLVIMTLCFTFVLPVLNAFILLRLKIIRSLDMHTREERRLPLLITAIFYFSQYYLLHEAEVSSTLKLLMLIAIISITLTIIINVFWKISAHMIGIGGITGMAIILCSLFNTPAAVVLPLLFLVAGIVGYARLTLEAHRPAEVYAGFALGLLCPMVFLF
ncbi:MAG: hypothetical protein AB1458_09760 [Bacteroidota bacterium]